MPFFVKPGFKILVDLAGTLIALGYPALSTSFRFSPRLISFFRLGLFLVPMAYFSYHGYVWPGLLFFVAGLCSLALFGASCLNFVGAGLLAGGMLATRFAESFVSEQALNQAIIANAHTDYALKSMHESFLAEGIAISLLVILVLYGIRCCSRIKDDHLRAVASVGMSLMAVQILTSVFANIGLLPMVSAGINIPFISYGGSGIVANFLTVGVLVGCLKRRTIGQFA